MPFWEKKFFGTVFLAKFHSMESTAIIVFSDVPLMSKIPQGRDEWKEGNFVFNPHHFLEKLSRDQQSGLAQRIKVHLDRGEPIPDRLKLKACDKFLAHRQGERIVFIRFPHSQETYEGMTKLLEKHNRIWENRILHFKYTNPKKAFFKHQKVNNPPDSEISRLQQSMRISLRNILKGREIAARFIEEAGVADQVEEIDLPSLKSFTPNLFWLAVNGGY